MVWITNKTGWNEIISKEQTLTEYSPRSADRLSSLYIAVINQTESKYQSWNI